MSNMTPGQYTSLPLDRRVDLIMPKPKPRPKAVLEESGSSQHDDYSHAPQSTQQQAPPPAFWDAQRYSPPTDGKPEMSVPMNTFYDAAWNQPSSQQTSFYSDSAKQNAEPQYPIIPESVRNDTWYSHFANLTPNRSSVKAVFPWEQQAQEHRKPDRVFPQGSSALDFQSVNDTARSVSADMGREPSSSPGSAPPGRSLSEAMASYSNAWDSMPSIQRYVDRVSGRSGQMNLGDMPRGFDMSLLKSVPNTPHYQSVPFRQRQRSNDRISNVSGDGDDEDDGDEQDDTDRFDSPIIGPSNTGQMLSKQSFPHPENIRYRDRQAQTERRPLVDAKVQVSPGGGSSPALRMFALPKNGSRRTSGNSAQTVQALHSSSSESTPRASHLLTPTAEHPHPPSSTRIPFPTNPHASRRLSNNGNGNGNNGQATTSTQGSSSMFRGKSSGASTNVDSLTESGVPRPDQRATRKFDPSTDPDVRKKDTEQVLSRFMQGGSF